MRAAEHLLYSYYTQSHVMAEVHADDSAAGADWPFTADVDEEQPEQAVDPVVPVLPAEDRNNEASAAKTAATTTTTAAADKPKKHMQSYLGKLIPVSDLEAELRRLKAKGGADWWQNFNIEVISNENGVPVVHMVCIHCNDKFSPSNPARLGASHSKACKAIQAASACILEQGKY